MNVLEALSVWFFFSYNVLWIDLMHRATSKTWDIKHLIYSHVEPPS